jgi:hypothetical protein
VARQSELFIGWLFSALLFRGHFSLVSSWTLFGWVFITFVVSLGLGVVGVVAAEVGVMLLFSVVFLDLIVVVASTWAASYTEE